MKKTTFKYSAEIAKEHELKAVILSIAELEFIIQGLRYWREEHGGDAELENDLEMVIEGSL
jgi:hypothetical protein